jgi:hypothetical protein
MVGGSRLARSHANLKGPSPRPARTFAPAGQDERRLADRRNAALGVGGGDYAVDTVAEVIERIGYDAETALAHARLVGVCSDRSGVERIMYG